MCVRITQEHDKIQYQATPPQPQTEMNPEINILSKQPVFK